MSSTPESGSEGVLLHGAARLRGRDPLRANLFQLLRRGYRAAALRGEGLEVYRSGASWTRELCGMRWAQDAIFRGESALVRRFLSEARLGHADPEGVVQHSLWANPWIATWAPVLMTMARESFSALCTVRGREHFDAARTAGRGVIVAHAHTLFAQLFWTWMKHEDVAAGTSIWQWAWGRPVEEIRDPRIRTVESARELHAALRSLRGAGLVHILADGLQGTRKRTLAFCNRARGFETTFAELAVQTGAAVLPAATTLRADGQICIVFEPVFEPGGPGAEPGVRVDGLLRQYVEHLGRLWRAHPADVSWFQMKRHLDLPPVAG